MALALNIYTDETSELTAEDLKQKLLSYPNMQAMEPSELQYMNEDTGVYCMIADEPPEEPAKGFRLLDMAFLLNYMRPNFFGLELFPLIEKIVTENGLLLDYEQEGKPAAFDRQWQYDEWLRVSDASIEQVIKEHGEQEPYARSQRDICNRRWRFLYDIAKLEAEVGDVYVARLFNFKDDEGGLVTAASWPDGIPILLPPGTDYVIVSQQKKKLFRQTTDFHGMVTVPRLVKEFPGVFKERPDGSLLLSQKKADDIRERVMAMETDLGPDEHPGVPVAADMIIDVPV